MTLLDRYNSPHRLHLETTKKCNLRCEHCYISADTSYNHYHKSALKESMLNVRNKGATRITFTGGEFLMREDHKELIEYAVSLGYENIYFISNGILIKKNLLRWLSSLKVKNNIKNILSITLGHKKPLTIGFAISIDGLEGNNLIRKNRSGGYLSYQKTLETIKLATNFGLYITVNTTICNMITAYELPQLYRELTKCKIDRWQIDQVFISGRSISNDQIQAYDKWIEKAKESYLLILKDYTEKYPSKTKMRLEIVQLFRSAILEKGFKIIKSDNYHPCSYQFGSIIIENENAIRFCPSLRHENDIIFKANELNISRKSYESNVDFAEFAHLTVNDLPCRNCRYKFLAHGGCRGNSISLNRKIHGKDPVCCELSPFLEKKIVPLLPLKLQRQYFDGIYHEGCPPHEITE